MSDSGMYRLMKNAAEQLDKKAEEQFAKDSPKEALAQALAWIDGLAGDYSRDAGNARRECHLRAEHMMSTLALHGWAVTKQNDTPVTQNAPSHAE